MPELPEVETVRRGLDPHLAGATIRRVELRRPDLRFPFPPDFARRLEGERVTALDRRAKYLLARLESGATLLMHLGMTGRFAIETAGRTPHAPGAFFHAAGGGAHDHVLITLAGGTAIRFNDARRFGFMTLIEAGALSAHPLLAGLGPEPLGEDFGPAVIAARARRRHTPLKSFLLDQRVVAGLGNIYVCEALHRAGLDPRREASRLALASGGPSAAAKRLARAIQDVLREAIAAGGSSLRDYVNAEGGLGYFQHAFAVYGRAGEACREPGCGGVIERTVQAGRSSFYCPRCQR